MSDNSNLSLVETKKKKTRREDYKHQSTDDSDILVLFIYFYIINILNYLIYFKFGF